MQDVRLKYPYVVFLSAYFYHLYLSLDRAQATSWNSFSEYYRNDFIHPEVVARSLPVESGITLPMLEKSLPFEAVKSRNNFRNWLRAALGRRSVFTFAEIQHGYQLLIDLAEALNVGDDHSKIPFIRDFFKRTINMNSSLSAKLLSQDKKRVQQVEHYLQSEHIKTLPISEFIRDFKLE